MSVSVSDQTFIDRSEIGKVEVTTVAGLLEPYPDTMTGVDHSAAYRIHAQRVGREEAVNCVVVGEWKRVGIGRFYFSPSGVMQNANRAGSAPRFEVSANGSLQALAGQLVSEYAKPAQEILDYNIPLSKTSTEA